MESINYILYVLFSIVNFAGCVWALCKMYNYFGPTMHIPRFFRLAIHGWICCLIAFALQQGNTIIHGDLGIAWGGKLAVTTFVWFSLKFSRIADYIKESL